MQAVRWKSCVAGCVNPLDGAMACNHNLKKSRDFYYLSVRDRLTVLLQSDLKNLFQYETYRYRSSRPTFVEDIYGSSSYSDLKSILPPNSNLIMLQICWDGADMFNYARNKSMWPLCYSIMNFPPSIRDKPHIGISFSFMNTT